MFQKQSYDFPVFWPTSPLLSPHCANSLVPQASSVPAEGLAWPLPGEGGPTSPSATQHFLSTCYVLGSTPGMTTCRGTIDMDKSRVSWVLSTSPPQPCPFTLEPAAAP